MEEGCECGVEGRVVEGELSCHHHELRVENNVEYSRRVDTDNV